MSIQERRFQQKLHRETGPTFDFRHFLAEIFELREFDPNQTAVEMIAECLDPVEVPAEPRPVHDEITYQVEPLGFPHVHHKPRDGQNDPKAGGTRFVRGPSFIGPHNTFNRLSGFKRFAAH